MQANIGRRVIRRLRHLVARIGLGGYVGWQFMNTPQPLVGLVQLQFDCTLPRLAKQTVVIRLQGGGAHAGQRDVLLDDQGRGRTWFALHTHLLDNGAHQLHASLQAVGQSRPIWTHAIDLRVDNVGPVAEVVSRSLRQHAVPLIVDTSCDASSYDYADSTQAAWFDQPDALDRIARWEAAGELTAELAGHFRHFVTEGYMALDGMIDEALVDAVNGDIDQAVTAGHEGYVYGSSQRIEHLHVHYPNVRRLFFDRRYLDVLDKLYGARARPCQTLTYVFGSQQDAHQDTVHLTPFPAGYMCGVWIALQDIQPESGELVIYPRSHRVPRLYMHQAGCAKVDGDWREFGEKMVPAWAAHIKQGGFEAKAYLPRKGSVLIWHENLIHAGSVRRNPDLPRRSIVIHTFADGAVVYYDSTGQVGHAVHRDLIPA